MENLWSSGFQLIGSLFEIVGVILMAKVYVRERFPNVLLTLISGLFGGQRARNKEAAMCSLPELAAPEHLSSLRGLALIAIGFFFTAIPSAIAVIKAALE